MIHATPLPVPHLQLMLVVGVAGCLTIGLHLLGREPTPREPSFLRRPAASRFARLVAAPFGFGVACLVAPLPVLALPEIAGEVGTPVLLMLPVLALFTGVFAGPFALPVILAMAWRDVRSVGWQVAWGMAVTLPAMAFFVASMPGELSATVAGAILSGGAIGGLACSATRDGVETVLQRMARRPERGFGPERVLAPLQSRRETL